jgi:hypothetical protein
LNDLTFNPSIRIIKSQVFYAFDQVLLST